MAETISQVSYVDFDVYGRAASQGGALLHKDDYAISNSIVFYLTSKRGSFLYQPSEGGVLDSLLFKLMNPELFNLYTSKISKKLKDVYRGLIKDINVIMYNLSQEDSRSIQIEVYYTSLLSNKDNQVIFYLKPKQNKLEIEYTNVQFEGDNLLGFVLLKKEDIPEEYKLIKNITDGYWYWGNYRLVNFSESSSNYDEIISIVNN